MHSKNIFQRLHKKRQPCCQKNVSPYHLNITPSPLSKSSRYICSNKSVSVSRTVRRENYPCNAYQHPYFCAAAFFIGFSPCYPVVNVPLNINNTCKQIEKTCRTEKHRIKYPHQRPIGGNPPFPPIPIIPAGIRSLFFLPLPFLPITPSCFIIFCISSN